MSSSWTLLVLLVLTTLLIPGLTLETRRGNYGHERQSKIPQKSVARNSVSDSINQLYDSEMTDNFIDLKQFEGDNMQPRQNNFAERRSYSQETRRQERRSFEKNSVKQDREKRSVEKRNVRRNENEHRRIEEQRIFEKRDAKNNNEEYRQRRELSNDFKVNEKRRQTIIGEKMSSRTQINNVRKFGDSESRQNSDTKRSDSKPASRNLNGIREIQRVKDENFSRIDKVYQGNKRKNEEGETMYIGRDSQRRRTEKQDIMKERRTARKGYSRDRNTGIRSPDKDFSIEGEQKRTNFASVKTQRGNAHLQSARQRRSNREEQIRQIETFSDSREIRRETPQQKRMERYRELNSEKEVIRTTARVSSQRNDNSRQNDGGEIVRRSMSESKQNSKRIVTDNARRREYVFSNKVNSRRTIERNRNDLRRKISG